MFTIDKGILLVPNNNMNFFNGILVNHYMRSRGLWILNIYEFPAEQVVIDQNTIEKIHGIVKY